MSSMLRRATLFLFSSHALSSASGPIWLLLPEDHFRDKLRDVDEPDDGKKHCKDHNNAENDMQKGHIVNRPVFDGKRRHVRYSLCLCRGVVAAPIGIFKLSHRHSPCRPTSFLQACRVVLGMLHTSSSFPHASVALPVASAPSSNSSVSLRDFSITP